MAEVGEPRMGPQPPYSSVVLSVLCSAGSPTKGLENIILALCSFERCRLADLRGPNVLQGGTGTDGTVALCNSSGNPEIRRRLSRTIFTHGD